MMASEPDPETHTNSSSTVALFPPSRSNSILENVNAASVPAPNPAGGQNLQPRIVYLRDHVTHATIYPVASAEHLSSSIIVALQNEFNQEIRAGDTYPMEEEMEFEKFMGYWFSVFAGVMLLGKPDEHGNLATERDWTSLVLGSFYIKPNYPGRSSHICNAGFLTTLAARGRGCGKLMGEAYLDFAPKLGFTYSVFNLVYENNVASTKIWDSLGFKRIGSIKGAGRLRSSPSLLVDAIIFGRDLKDDDDYVSEERFDKIRFYLEKGKYPPTADRSEKSRLRSAATHYRIANGKLMLKDKEVVSDSQLQYEIARTVHAQSHGGINKTTANIAEKYHWVRIKETVSQVIRNCAECKEHGKVPVVRGEGGTTPKRTSPPKQSNQQLLQEQQAVQIQAQLQHEQQQAPSDHQLQQQHQQLQPQQQVQQHHHHHQHHHDQQQQQHQISMQVLSSAMTQQPPPLLPNDQVSVDVTRAAAMAAVAAGMEIPVDPQMMEGVEHHHDPASQFVHQLHPFQAPVASMHPSHHHMSNHEMAVQAARVQQQQHAAAVAAARAALSEGGETLSEEDRMLKDRHLLETLTAELKREGYHDEDE